MWTCGDIFKTTYFLLREAPLQFWICGSLQVTVDLLILLQVFIYRGNNEPKRSATHRGDWVVIIWTHDEKRHKETKTNDDIVVLNEKNGNVEHVVNKSNGDAAIVDADNLDDDNDKINDDSVNDNNDEVDNSIAYNIVYNEDSPSVKSNTDSIRQVISAEVHNEDEVVNACVVSRDNSNVDDEEGVKDDSVVDIVNSKDYKNVNGDMVKRASRVSYKERATVSMLVHRHTLWRLLSSASIRVTEEFLHFFGLLKKYGLPKSVFYYLQ